MNEHAALEKLNRARKLLADAKTCDEVKKIHSRAEALRAYSQQQKWSVECYNFAAEIKLRAERRMGQLLSATPKNKGGQHTHRTGRGSLTSVPTLQELGIKKEESARYQKLSQLSEQEFDDIVSKTNAASERLTTQRILRELDGGNSSKRNKSAANTSSPEGTISVPITLLLKKECRTPFMRAWEFLGDTASQVTFKAVITTAKRRHSETHRANDHKTSPRLVA